MTWYTAKELPVDFVKRFTLRQLSTDGNKQFIDIDTGLDHVLWQPEWTGIVSGYAIGQSTDPSTGNSGAAFFNIEL